MKELIKQFESLGDNCEFALVKRSLGDLEGGLLRWSYSSNLDCLIKGLENSFDNVFQLKNLLPWADDMVMDQHYHMAFHSRLASREINCKRVFILNSEEQQEIYTEEKNIFDNLRLRLINHLTNADRCFVYKRNAYNLERERALVNNPNNSIVLRQTISESDIRLLHKALKLYNKHNRLLIVGTEFQRPAGEVWPIDNNIFCASISELAPYLNAHQINFPDWHRIIENCSSLV